jgi:hypothetical protein
MKNKFWIAFLLSVLLLSSIACSTSSLLSGSTNEGTASTSEETKNILLSEDYSNSKSGWDIYAEDLLSADYENGMYVITNDDPQSYAWGIANKYFTDTSIEMDTQLLSGPMDVESGIICRKNGNNFYYGLISIDGYYGIFKSTEEDFLMVQMENMPFNNAIKLGNEVNRVRFDCIGSTLSLFANDILLAEVTDPDYTSGDIGLIVGTYDDPGAKFGFDNLVVLKP